MYIILYLICISYVYINHVYLLMLIYRNIYQQTKTNPSNALTGHVDSFLQNSVCGLSHQPQRLAQGTHVGKLGGASTSMRTPM